MRDYDVCVIGSGAAGLMAAIQASAVPGCALITDGPLGKSMTRMAQGGLQLPVPGAEALARFEEDILRSARVELDRRRVRNFVEHVGETIEMLVDWGLTLDCDAAGEIVRRRAGGLSEPRIVSVRDQIGPAIMKVLLRVVRERQVDVIPHTEVTAIHQRDHGFTLGIRERDGSERELRAQCVVCCSGGVTYRQARQQQAPTTNPPNENHRLFEHLVEVGLQRVHEGYFQYQPFGIVDTWGEEYGRCVPESITNYPVRLLDAKGDDIGEVRRDRYDLTHHMFQLAEEGRAVESTAGNHGFWLTLEDVDREALESVFPKVHQHLERTGGGTRNLLVFPYLHYYLGGFRTGTRCETEIEGLFLAGEMVGGLHGRNRLMGNGITDSLVHGVIAGRSARGFVGGLD